MVGKVRLSAWSPERKRQSLVSRSNTTNYYRSGNTPYERIQRLQRTLGNRQVQRLLKEGASLRRSTEKSPCAVHVYDNSDPKDTAVIPKDGSGIGVTSVADMVTKVNAHVDDPENACSCVSRLEINGHGTDGYQSVGNGDQYINNEKALVYESEDDHLKRMADIKFCSRGLLMLLGCHVGRGNGKTLLSKLSGILPGKRIGGAQHFTGGVGLGNKLVTGEGDAPNTPYSERDPFLTSKFVRWHLTIDGKESVINGTETTSTEGKAKLKVADKIKVKTPEGVVKIK